MEKGKGMKKITMINILLIIIAIVSFACSDDSVSNNNTASYLPLNIGNYWVYKTVETDRYGSISNTYTDSLLVINSQEYKKFPSYQLQHFRDGILTDTLIISVQGNNIFKINNQLEYIMPVTTGEWMKIADFDSESSWNVLYLLGYNNNIEYLDSVYETTEDYTVNAGPPLPAEINFNGTDYEAAEIRLFDDSRKFFVLDIDTTIIDFKWIFDTTYYEKYQNHEHFARYIENIGLFSYEKIGSFSLIVHNNEKEYQPGFKSTLLRYKLY